MRTFLFINPLSGHYTDRHLKHSLERLRSGGITPEIFQVRTPAEIYACCDKINTQCEQSLVIVAGGDGTFNAVVNGLKPNSTTLAVLPFGTSNVLAAEIGIKSIDDGLERIIAGKTSPLSVGVIDFEGRSLRFVLMAGIGFDGQVVRDVWPLGKRWLRQGAYVISAIKNLLTWDHGTFTVKTPDADATCHTAVICNASRYGGDFILAPESSPFKPSFTIACITGKNRSDYISCALDLSRHVTESTPSLLRLRASAVAISGRRPIQLDGDFVGYGPATVSEYVDFAKMIV